MRIVYTGVLGAVMMKSLSYAGFICGIFALVLLFPFCLAIRDFSVFLKLKRRGIRSAGVISEIEKRWGYKSHHWEHKYWYRVEGVRYHGRFVVGYPSKKYRKKKKIVIYYEKENPVHHMIYPNQLYLCIGELFLGIAFFLPVLIGFAVELVKCF